jgi:hypothetical protein
MKQPPFKLICKKCGGLKGLGDEYYSLEEYWVDVTCVKCGHSADSTVKDLTVFFNKLSGNKYSAY